MPEASQQGVGNPTQSQQAEIASRTAKNKSSNVSSSQNKNVENINKEVKQTSEPSKTKMIGGEEFTQTGVNEQGKAQFKPTTEIQQQQEKGTEEQIVNQQIEDQNKRLDEMQGALQKSQKDVERKFGEIEQSNQKALDELSSSFSGFITNMGGLVGQWQEANGKQVDVTNPEYQQSVEEAARSNRNGTLSEQEFQAHLGRLNNKFSIQPQEADVNTQKTDSQKIVSDYTDVNPNTETVSETGEVLTEDQKTVFDRNKFFQANNSYEGMLGMILDSGMAMEDLDSGQIMQLKLASMQGALSEKVYNELSAQAKNQSDFINESVNEMKSFLADQKELAEDIADSNKQEQLDEMAIAKMRLEAEKDSTMGDLQRKSDRFEAYAKAKLMNSGVSLDGTAGLMMLGEMTANFAGQVSNTEAQYDMALADISMSELKIKRDHVNDILKIESDYKGSLLQIHQDADSKILDIQSNLLKNQSDIEMETFQVMSDSMVKVQALDAEKKAAQAESAQQAWDNSVDMMKYHTEQSGYFYNIAEDGSIDVVLDENGEAIPTISKLKLDQAANAQALDSWYKQAQVTINNSKLSLDEKIHLLNIAKFNAEQAGGTEYDDLFYGSAVTYNNIGNGNITQDYGGTATGELVLLANGKKGTPGLDIDGKTGDPIYATTAGTITRIGDDPDGLGRYAIVTDREGNEHYYNHLSSWINEASEGADVKIGDVVGLMGNTGRVFDMNGNKPGADDTETGSHLDYRVKDSDGNWIDPNQFMNRDKQINDLIVRDAFNWASTTPTKQQAIQERASKYGYSDAMDKIIRGDYSDLIGAEGSKYTNAIKNVLKDTETKPREIAAIAKAYMDGDIDFVKGQTHNAIRNKMLAEEKKGFDGAKDIMRDMVVMKKVFDIYKDDTGLIPGNIEKVYQWVGKTSNPELAALGTESSRIIQKYTKAQSGAQFSAQEFERYRVLFPGIMKDGELNDANIKGFYNGVKREVDSDISNATSFKLNTLEDVLPSNVFDLYIMEDDDMLNFIQENN